MPQSLSRLYVHLVFSTKSRSPFLIDPDIRAEVHAYLGGICKHMASPPFAIGGIEDHVHLLCNLDRGAMVKDLVRYLKIDSTKWIKRKWPEYLPHFQWQRGYGAFSVSPTHLGKVTAYIRNQEQHHRRQSFQDEMRGFFERYDIEYDERYVWD